MLKKNIDCIEFNRLEKNLYRIDPNYDYFSKNNKIFLPSIESSDYKAFLRTLLKKTRLIIEPQIKGCSIGISYKNGKFNKAISKKGLDLSSKITKIQNIPYKVPIKKDFQVRGEVYIENESPSFSTKFSFKYLSNKEGFQKDIRFCCFQILNGRLNQSSALNYLKKCGFNTPESYQTNFTSQVEIFRRKWLNKELFRKYPTNGIVIKINSRKLQLIRENSKGMYRNWQYSIKN
tara:strand:- start:25 stop:723 length:699 start_codon:yes stop_codon:yes gene_type:complete